MHEYDYTHNKTLNELEEERADRELQAKYAALYGVIDAQGCSNCASIVGMESWYPDEINESNLDQAQIAWYAHDDIKAAVYSPCPVCNPRHDIPDEYLPLSWREVIDWIEEQLEAQREYRRKAEISAVMAPYHSHYADSRDAAEAPAVQ